MKGAEAEDRALAYLKAQGLKLVARNVRAPGGELDLVMLDGSVLALIEVRARSRSAFASAAESVDARKQRRIILAARHYLARHPEHAARAVRFDVVALEADAPPEWLRAAFDAN